MCSCQCLISIYISDQIISSGECSGLMCIGGHVAAWDDPCAFGTTTPRTTIPPTPRRTTTPPVPPGGCVYNNVVYADGKLTLLSLSF